MEYKVIFSGRLEFGTSRSFEQVVKQFEHRKENYYRGDVLFDLEDIFIEEQVSLVIPRRLLKNITQKSWRNTVNILKQVAQFAIAGDINAWKLDASGLVEHLIIEPETEKTAVQAFIKGRELVQEKGMETEAYAALTRAIDKFARHALAYERRGFVNYRLQNYDDALYDYNKSIDINPNKPEPYMGRAMIHIKKGDTTAAIGDLEQVMRYAIPHQNMYWQARLLKGDKLFEMGKAEEAAYEYGLFLKRNFPANHPMINRRRKVQLDCGRALLASGKVAESISMLDDALATPAVDGGPKDAEILVHRGLARQQEGNSGFKDDWKAAADKGSKKAEKLLAEL